MTERTEDQIAARLRDMFGNLFEGAEVQVERLDPRALEHYTLEVNAYGDTAREIEDAVTDEARKFFGEGACLHVLPGWEAVRNAYHGAENSRHPHTREKYVVQKITVIAHGRLPRGGKHRMNGGKDSAREPGECAA